MENVPSKKLITIQLVKFCFSWNVQVRYHVLNNQLLDHILIRSTNWHDVFTINFKIFLLLSCIFAKNSFSFTFPDLKYVLMCNLFEMCYVHCPSHLFLNPTRCVLYNPFVPSFVDSWLVQLFNLRLYTHNFEYSVKMVCQKENRNCSFSRARLILRIGILIFLLKFYHYVTDSALLVRGIEGARMCSAVCDSGFKCTPWVCNWQVVVLVIVIFVVVIMTVIITHRVSCPWASKIQSVNPLN